MGPKLAIVLATDSSLLPPHRLLPCPSLLPIESQPSRAPSPACPRRPFHASLVRSSADLVVCRIPVGIKKHKPVPSNQVQAAAACKGAASA